MYGLLQALFYLKQRQKSIETIISKSKNKEKVCALEETLINISETINFIHQQLNEFLLYINSTNPRMNKVIKKRFFEAKTWNEATFDFYTADEDEIRMSIKRLCDKYDGMSQIEKEAYLK